MLFNSYSFIFLFLPVCLIAFFALGRHHHLIAGAWLAAASLAFYAVGAFDFVPILLFSIIFNFLLGRLLVGTSPSSARLALTSGIAVNLVLLGYCKYWNFFVDTYSALSGSQISLAPVVLPIGISFYTFTQIAFLVDAYRGAAREYNLVHYALFVSYFPHLIAGPILHHKEMMPQFAEGKTYEFDLSSFSVGVSIFTIGLLKKVAIADNLSPYVAALFSTHDPTLLFAWQAALAYTFQIYFDFSGYTDMAIGLSKMFNIELPLNFDSPYRASSIIDFWRRWHMTLSRFLRDYLYIPLGGNRCGPLRRYVNLLVTMLLGGLWHGAGWTFIVWGGLHGVYLVINHGWRALCSRVGLPAAGVLGRLAARGITFVAVVVAWVFFRAETMSTAMDILKGMMGLNGVVLPPRILRAAGFLGEWLQAHGVQAGLNSAIRAWDLSMSSETLGRWLIALCIIVWFAPNTQEIFHRYFRLTSPAAAPRALRFQPTLVFGVSVGIGLFLCLGMLSNVSEFIYFRF